MRHAAHSLEVAQQVKANAGQPSPRSFQAVGLDGEGQVFRFDDAVVAAGKLLLQDGGVLGADVVIKAVGLSEGSMIRVALILVYSGGSGAGFLLSLILLCKVAHAWCRGGWGVSKGVKEMAARKEKSTSIASGSTKPYN